MRKGPVARRKTSHPALTSLLSRRTEILRYRQLVINAVSAAYPNAIGLDVIVTSGRIKTIKQLYLGEVQGLLSELVAEKIFLEQPGNGSAPPMYLFNYGECGSMHHNANRHKLKMPEREAKVIKSTESMHQKEERLLHRRVHTFSARQNQFLQDVETLLPLLPECPFSASDALGVLPSEWRQHKSRGTVPYLMQCLLCLLKDHRIQRNEGNGLFIALSEVPSMDDAIAGESVPQPSEQKE
jgi:hypothetical protein